MASLRSKSTQQGFVIDVAIKSLDLKTSIQTFTKSVREARRITSEVTANEKRVRSGDVNFQSEKYADLTAGELCDAVLHFLRTGELPPEDVQDDRFLPLSHAVSFFLAEHERRGTAAVTIVGYRDNMQAVADWLSKNGDGDIFVSRITRPVLQKMTYEMCDEKMKQGKRKGEYINVKTVDKRVGRLRAVLKECITHDMTMLTHADLHILFDGLKFKRHGSKYDVLKNRDFQTLAERRETIKREGLSLDDRLCYQKLYLSEAELRRFFKVVRHRLDGPKHDTPRFHRVHAVLVFACYTGLRRAEIVRLRRKDVDLEAGTFRAFKMKGRGERKTHIEHVQTMPQALTDFLTEWMDRLPNDQASVFAPNDGHLTANGFDEMAVLHKANGLTRGLLKLLEGTEFEFCGFHIFRHSFASRLVELGATPEEGAAIIGHATTVMFQHYAHRSRLQRDAVLTSFGDPTGEKRNEA